MSDITKEEYCRIFVAYMAENAGFERFANGQSIRDYAKSVASDYWQNTRDRTTPEEDAEADMDCWEGEE
jgi:hypothetical protein